MKPPPGAMLYAVLETRNIVNNMTYIFLRKKQFDNSDHNALGEGPAIVEAIATYGKESFERRTLAEFMTREEAFAYKASIVDWEFINDPTNYNMMTGEIGGRHLEETLGRISEIALNRTEEEKRRAIAPQIGKKLTEEHKKRISDGHRGKILSEEHKKKISDSHRGVPLSDYHRQRIGDSLRGRKGNPRTPQQTQRAAATLRRRTLERKQEQLRLAMLRYEQTKTQND